jgi:hypothetical protein
MARGLPQMQAQGPGSLPGDGSHLLREQARLGPRRSLCLPVPGPHRASMAHEGKGQGAVAWGLGSRSVGSAAQAEGHALGHLRDMRG